MKRHNQVHQGWCEMVKFIYRHQSLVNRCLLLSTQSFLLCFQEKSTKVYIKKSENIQFTLNFPIKQQIYLTKTLFIHCVSFVELSLGFDILLLPLACSLRSLLSPLICLLSLLSSIFCTDCSE